MDRVEHDLSDEQWAVVKTTWGGCAYCGASKCNDEVTGWLRRKRLDERTFLLRHVEIRAALALRFPSERAETAR